MSSTIIVSYVARPSHAGHEAKRPASPDQTVTGKAEKPTKTPVPEPLTSDSKDEAKMHDEQLRRGGFVKTPEEREQRWKENRRAERQARRQRDKEAVEGLLDDATIDKVEKLDRPRAAHKRHSGDQGFKRPHVVERPLKKRRLSPDVREACRSAIRPQQPAPRPVRPPLPPMRTKEEALAEIKARQAQKELETAMGQSPLMASALKRKRVESGSGDEELPRKYLKSEAKTIERHTYKKVIVDGDRKRVVETTTIKKHTRYSYEELMELRRVA